MSPAGVAGFDEPRDAAQAVLGALKDFHAKNLWGVSPDLASPMAFREDLDDPAFWFAVKQAAKVNDKYDLMKEARRLAACFGRREAAWKAESDLTKDMTVVGGGALIVASIGRWPWVRSPWLP
jgi:hypothetical protein